MFACETQHRNYYTFQIKYKYQISNHTNNVALNTIFMQSYLFAFNLLTLSGIYFCCSFCSWFYVILISEYFSSMQYSSLNLFYSLSTHLNFATTVINLLIFALSLCSTKTVLLHFKYFFGWDEYLMGCKTSSKSPVKIFPTWSSHTKNRLSVRRTNYLTKNYRLQCPCS